MTAVVIEVTIELETNLALSHTSLTLDQRLSRNRLIPVLRCCLL